MDAGAPRTAKEPETIAICGDRVELTDPDVDALGWQFLNFGYVGDSSNIVLHRVMFRNGVLPHQGGERVAGAERSHELADTGPAGGPSANGGVVSARASRCPDDQTGDAAPHTVGPWWQRMTNECERLPVCPMMKGMRQIG
jgi:hypothetical protein